MSASATLGPWVAGIDQLTHPTRLGTLEQKAVRDAVNVLISREGFISTIGSPSAQWPANAHSFFQAHDGKTLCVVDGVLSSLNEDGTVAAIQDFGSNLPTSYTLLNDSTIVSNLTGMARYANGALYPLVLDTPRAPSVFVGAPEQPERLCGYAVSALSPSGRESGLSEITFAPYGLAVLSGLPNPCRIYRTQPDGDVLYHVVDHRSDQSATVGTDVTPGPMPTTQYLHPQQPGEFVRVWKGRLLTVRGPVLYAGEPLNFGLQHGFYGFLTLPDPITFIEPVEAGIFVGQRDHVLFLRGNEPGKLTVERTLAAKPIRRASTLISIQEGPLVETKSPCAVWAGQRGFAFGLPTGEVLEPQTSRIRLFASEGALCVLDNRLYLSI